MSVPWSGLRHPARRAFGSLAARMAMFAVAAPAAGVAAGPVDAATRDDPAGDTPAGGGAPFAGPVRLVVPFGAGGIADLSARAVARGMEPLLGTTIIIENKPGAGGVVAGTQVARARPDGRTLLLVSNGTAVSEALFRSLPFDALADFSAIATLGGFPIAITVRDGSPYRSLADLLADARRRPGALNIGTIAIGSTQHLSAELFRTVADLDFTVVPFNGTPNLVTAIRAGDVDAGFEIVGPLKAQVDGGALRLLAVGSARRSAIFAAVPTVAEAGVDGYDVVSWNGLAAPKGTPAETVARLAAAAAAALDDPQVRQALRQLGVEPLAEGPAGLEVRLRREIDRWRAVVERAGIARQ